MVKHLLLFSCLLALAQAQILYHHYTPAELVVVSCKAAIADVTEFCSGELPTDYQCTCQLPQGLGSLMNCVYNETYVYSSDVEGFVLGYCRTTAGTLLTPEKLRQAYDNATKYLTDINVLPGYNATDISYVPVEYNASMFTNTYKSTYYAYKNVEFAFWMGGSLIGYWALIFFVAMWYNLLNRAFSLSQNLHSHPINLIRKYVTIPATLGKRHTHPVMFFKVTGGFIPTRLESLVLFLYFTLMVCFAATGYTYVPNDTIWDTRTVEMAGYPGDRCGILCLFSFILSFLFAGRNNFLLWITGWKQSTFLTYHKWVSRMNFLLLITHASCVTIQSKASGPAYYQLILSFSWLKWGVVSLCSIFIIMITASYRVRKTHYEVFVLSHLVLVSLFLVGAWNHVYELGWDKFCYVMASLWCFDRFVRYCRLAYFGVQTAKVSVVSEEVLKVVVPRHSMWKTFPGAYGYLHYIRPTTFFQSHPFTIVESDAKTITFYTKIKGGVTSNIHQHLSKSLDKTGFINVSVEGPYGHQRDLHKYDTVIHFTGGTGVPTSYAYIHDAISKQSSQYIKLYWVIRNWHSLDWFYDELLKLNGHAVDVVIYVTKPDSAPGIRHLSISSGSSDGSDDLEKVDGSAIDGKNMEVAEVVAAGMPPRDLDFIEFRYGRPDVDSLVEADIRESNGTVAIFSAAHNAMVDDVRYAVAQNLDKGKARVEYFEELQAW